MKTITLKPFTLKKAHSFYQNYQADPAMWGENNYSYDKEWVENYYKEKALDPTRKVFALCLENQVIGEVELKRISLEKGEATLSIHLQKDECKGKGYGTKGETLIINYGFQTLGLNRIYADSLKTNKRSQHVLEKVGFIKTHEEGMFVYYQLDK